MSKTCRVILTRVIIGIVAYICFVQPNVWRYGLKTLSPSYSTIERIVDAKGVVLCRERLVNSPVSGIVMKVKSDLARVSKDETVAIIFPTIEDYNSYIREVNGVTSYYDNAIREKNSAIEDRKREIEKIYGELNRASELLSSLVASKQDITDVLGKIGELNSRIDSLKNELVNLTNELEGLKREKVRKLASLKEKAVSSNTRVTVDSSGLISFCTDGREDIRNAIIEKGLEGNIDLKIDALIREPKVIADGDPVKKGDVIAKVIDNLEQFVLLEVSLDGKSPISHSGYHLNIDGKDVGIELIKWISSYPKELWLCRIKSPYYIGPRYISLRVDVGTVEGLVIPKSLIREEKGRYFVYVVNGNSIEKRFIEILGGNEREVAIENVDRSELLFVD